MTEYKRQRENKSFKFRKNFPVQFKIQFKFSSSSVKNPFNLRSDYWETI